ncbi:MAG: 2-oxo acid dehydrogenase subunit E2 [Deltaproteobacteria bacterium]|nr:2-oxo acid dehydrogenase subunit E2 [Deltaproteobacteria bacterium]
MNIFDPEDYIARRLHMIRTFSEKRVGPTVLATIEVNMENALHFREEFNRESDIKVSINDMIIKATGNALTGHRLYTWAYNGRYRLFPTDKIDIRAPVDVGDDLGMLIIRDVDKKSLREVAEESKKNLKQIKDLTQARLDKLAELNRRFWFLRPLVSAGRKAFDLATIFSGDLEEWVYKKHREALGTFLISNLGKLGVNDVASPIVTPSIVQMNVSAIENKKIVENGQLREVRIVKLIGKLDHRITDVAQTVRFLKDIKKNLEEPENGLKAIK